MLLVDEFGVGILANTHHRGTPPYNRVSFNRRVEPIQETPVWSTTVTTVFSKIDGSCLDGAEMGAVPLLFGRYPRFHRYTRRAQQAIELEF